MASPPPLLLLLLLLLFALSGSRSLQDNNGDGLRKQNISSSVPSLPEPRTFLGAPVVPPLLVLNGSHGVGPPPRVGPPPSVAPPRRSIPAAAALVSLSNATVAYLRGPLSTRVLPTLDMLTVAVGIPANGVILYALSAKARRVSGAVLYCSLAVSDLLLLVSVGVKTHYRLHGNHWTLGDAACRLVTACFYGNLYGSALTLACISITRYLAVVHPFLYRRMPKRACGAAMCVGVWGVFGAAVAPELAVRQSFWLPQLKRSTCHDVLPLGSSSHAALLYCHLALAVGGLLLPLAVTTASFGRIIRELSRSHLDWAAHIKASALVLTIFLLCFLPASVLHLLHVVQLLAGEGEELYAHFNMAVCLCCAHAALDPFLFLFMSRSTRAQLYSTSKGKSIR